MIRRHFAVLGACLLTVGGHAAPSLLVSQSPSEQCRSAIAIAEQSHAVPPQLLAAIGHVESGRRDPSTGIGGAWPWSINAEGQGAWFESKSEAVKAVEDLQGRGVRSIDVGCMQVNLKYHPVAFADLAQAFDPVTNADYAARFLVRLYGLTGVWTTAAAYYHSADPAEGEPYAAKVAAVWPEERRKAGVPVLLFTGSNLAMALAVGRSGPLPRGLPPLLAPTRAGPLARVVTAFPPRPPPPIFTLTGMAPGLRPHGSASISTSQRETAFPRIMPLGSAQSRMSPRGLATLTMTPGGLPPSGLPFGKPSLEGLTFHWAAPVAVPTPLRLAGRLPSGALMR